jgi:Ca2+-transporting ATPase
MTPEDTLRLLNTSLDGLTTDEAVRRAKTYGPNEIPRKAGAPWWKILLDQFKNPLVLILLGAAFVEYFSEGMMHGVVIFVLVLMMTGLGFFEESRAQVATTSLLSMVTPKAKVRRGGRADVIPHRDIVPGDILLLEAGDKVPADARLLEAFHLTVSESALTGESLPVEKDVRELPDGTLLAERVNMLYMGTVITAGRAVAAVTETGIQTEFGKIARAIAEQKPEKTPLQKSIDGLSIFTTKAAGAVIVLIFLIGLLRGIGLKEIFMLSVTAAVSVIPEGLPFAVTAVLSVGMRIMAGRNVIIRKLSAVETLGAATVICSDKTGTMTLNRMTARQIFTKGKIYSLPSGDPALTDILRIGALCNDAYLLPEKGPEAVAGDPMEGALLLAALDSGVKKEDAEKACPRIFEIPFHSHNKWMATFHDVNGRRVAYIKGALEKLIEMASHVGTAGGIAAITDKDKEEFIRVHNEMALKAMRVLAVGYADQPADCDRIDESCVRGRLVLCGLIGMIDPPRKEVIKSIDDCRKAGIRVVMITGDDATTAAAIGKEVGLASGGVLTGKEIVSMDEKALREKVRNVSVFARIDPLDKLRIVAALQSNDHVVAMTGDGVNDAPALEKADIGVAMGITGTDVAKEASNMILRDDNFTSIVAAIEEGRAIFDRLRNVTAFMLTICLGEVIYLVMALSLLGTAPLEPIQILWLNIVAGSLIVIPLGFEPKTGNELLWPARRKKTNLLYAGMLLRIFSVSVFLAIVLLLMFKWCLAHMPLREARTVMFSAEAIFEWFLVFCFRSDRETLFTLGLFRNKWLISAIGLGLLLQLAVNYFQEVHEWFHIVPMEPYQWLLAFIPGILLFIATMTRKLLFPNIFSRGKW